MPLASQPRVSRALSIFVALAIAGCTSPLFRGQSPETDELDELVEISNRENDHVRLVGDLAIPWGLSWLKVEGVGLVTQLKGTGSDPPPSQLRNKLIKEMQTHKVDRSAQHLASDNTSMVIVRGFIPPGAQKGDRFDVEVRTPSRSKTSSFRSGWLMQARLRELQVLDTVREGHVAGLAMGPILVDSTFVGTGDPVSKTRGRVAGGGRVQKSRPLGLAISNEFSSVKTSSMIGVAINERFHHDRFGQKQGVANPKSDNQIELAIHPRYRKNLGRYIRVIRSIAVGETPADRSLRLVTLQRMLFEPTTAEVAALQLEAIGEAAGPTLREGILSGDPEVRFYAAEALAYLDDPAAVEPLRQAAEFERAFRWRALTALAAIDSYEAKDALTALMNLESAETRYGAFRALRVHNHLDPIVRGKVLDGQFAFHSVAVEGTPLIHFSRTRRPEVVVFGKSLQLQPPNFLYAGDAILIKKAGPNRLRLSCFRPGEDDKFEVCSTDLAEVIEKITSLGGTYADVFEALQSAKSQGYLAARIEVDSIPLANRQYQRNEGRAEEGRLRVTNPIPEMFSDRLSGSRGESSGASGSLPEDIDAIEDERTKPGFFGKLGSWFVE